MSKLALLIGAKPHKDKIGPLVRFEPGRYVVELENVVDSVILLCNAIGSFGQITHGQELNLAGGDYFTHITTSGKEKFINVSMNRVN
jgi:hypothetical protein